MSESTVHNPHPIVHSPQVPRGSWKPVLTLLLLAPAVGELLSGSSPPLQFFNPIFLLLLVGLYGCGALLVRETVFRCGLEVSGLLLLGVAYAIVEEGLTCKSFFNPHWNDVGYLSTYGRALGVNWLWTMGLTAYHTIVSITVPIFVTEALFAERATTAWLRRRGWAVAGSCLFLVTLLGFVAFDTPQFHPLELKEPVALVRKINAPPDAVTQFVADQFTAKNKAILAKNLEGRAASPELRRALVDELNRLLPRADLYSPERFASVSLGPEIQQRIARHPRGDDLVKLNRALLECACPNELARRANYPFHPAWPLTLACLAAIGALIRLALRQNQAPTIQARPPRPWRNGVLFTLLFVLVGFLVPGLVENGLPIPAVVTAGLWFAVALLMTRILRRLDAAPDRLWRRGLWALGVLTPWILFATLLGIFVQMQGAKKFSGMTFVAIAFGAGILCLGLRWRRRLGV